MITIHWIWLAVLVGIGFYIGLLGAVALRANDWNEEEDDPEERYEPPLAEKGYEAIYIKDVGKTLKITAEGMFVDNGDGKWESVMTPDEWTPYTGNEERGKEDCNSSSGAIRQE